MAQTVHVHLRELICKKEGNSWRKTEPYLWTIFFKIDGEHVNLSEKFKLSGEVPFHFSKGSHGNLEIDEIKGGQSVGIPIEMGVFQTTLTPIQVPFFNYEIPGILGVITVLMEKENVSSEGAEAGHKALNEFVQKAVTTAVHEFDVKNIDVENIQESIRIYFAAEVEKFVEGIEEAVASAVVEAQNIFQNLWALLDRDDLIGYKIWDVNLDELQESQGNYPLHVVWNAEKTGHWELIGEIKLEEAPASIDVQID
ncbi:MAG: hypothetical protein AAFY71_23340 [Bacteroidota bacterium]